jgi:hypothetical protein
MLRFKVQTLQDPPFCSSTHFSLQECGGIYHCNDGGPQQGGRRGQRGEAGDGKQPTGREGSHDLAEIWIKGTRPQVLYIGLIILKESIPLFSLFLCTELCNNASQANNSPQFTTAKTQYRKFETNIFRKEIVGPQSQFPHSCVCERFIKSHDRSAYSSAGHMKVEIGTEAAHSQKRNT